MAMAMAMGDDWWCLFFYSHARTSGYISAVYVRVTWVPFAVSQSNFMKMYDIGRQIAVKR